MSDKQSRGKGKKFPKEDTDDCSITTSTSTSSWGYKPVADAIESRYADTLVLDCTASGAAGLTSLGTLIVQEMFKEHVFPESEIQSELFREHSAMLQCITHMVHMDPEFRSRVTSIIASSTFNSQTTVCVSCLPKIFS